MVTSVESRCNRALRDYYERDEQSFSSDGGAADEVAPRLLAFVAIVVMSAALWICIIYAGLGLWCGLQALWRLL